MYINSYTGDARIYISIQLYLSICLIRCIMAVVFKTGMDEIVVLEDQIDNRVLLENKIEVVVSFKCIID